jgi:alpha-N-arabinofuranosidase
VTSVSIRIDATSAVGPVNRRLFGSFVEHMGRGVYTGIYEPGHPTADEDGFRRDVLELTRELGVTIVRYPGGNFVSGYRWEDGIGPAARRPVRRDLAWHGLETNEIGIDEFARWARKADVEIMYALNLGTRGVQAALDVHEYLNHPQGTHLSELRRSNGTTQPHDVRIFCLGNEMDGPWQIGHKTAHEYGRLAVEVARALRAADPGLELVACGSSNSSMPTFGSWEATVLQLAYDQVDHISAHAYYEEVDGDLGGFLASAVDMDQVIDSIVATADSVGARLESSRRINISFDEWNVWYQSRFNNAPAPTTWEVGQPVIEDHYNAADAVVVGNLLIALLRHTDRVAVACQAQLVNVIAPIMTEPGGRAWRQTIFHPFALTSRLARGTVLRMELDVPTYQTARFGAVPLLDAVATHDPEAGETVLFVVNRGLSEPCDIRVRVAHHDDVRVLESWTVGGADPYDRNTAAEPDRVRPVHLGATVDGDGTLSARLPPVSWSVIRMAEVPAA